MKKYTIYKGEEFIPAGPLKNTIAIGSGITATKSDSFYFGDGISRTRLQFREIMQDYKALGYPDLLEHATALLDKEIKRMTKSLIKNHCS